MADTETRFAPQPRAKRGVIGPFGGRQLLAALAIVVVGAIVLVAVTTPLARVGAGPSTAPLPTAYVIGAKPAEGLQPGQQAPELAVTRGDGSRFQLSDLDGRPVRLADLRGKLVWLNFWASWCPPCQAETPVLRAMDEAYRDRGLAIVGISVQETTVDDVRAYAQRYGLGYDVAFDVSADVFHRYKVYALPTQFFVGPDGLIREVVNGPLDAAAARLRIESWLPARSTSASP
ncbi:MAG: TlpA disulfide reductase family protein [Chloroflexota bacterium]|jgi:thiol-disulfide isomerase/thioredoxin